jgi:hypothetical protein
LSLPISQSTAESPEIEIFLDSGNDEDTGSAHSIALHSTLTVRATVSPLPTTHSNGKSRRQNDFFDSQPHSSPYPTESQDTFCSTEQNSSPADDELAVPPESQNENVYSGVFSNEDGLQNNIISHVLISDVETSQSSITNNRNRRQYSKQLLLSIRSVLESNNEIRSSRPIPPMAKCFVNGVNEDTLLIDIPFDRSANSRSRKH